MIIPVYPTPQGEVQIRQIGLSDPLPGLSHLRGIFVSSKHDKLPLTASSSVSHAVKREARLACGRGECETQTELVILVPRQNPSHLDQSNLLAPWLAKGTGAGGEH